MLFPILYQPVTFITGDYLGYEAEGASCNQCFAPPYCQMVEKTDLTQFQMGICDFNDTELVQDGDFSEVGNWVVSGGWSIDTGAPQANATGAGTLSQELKLTAGHTYIVKYFHSFSDNGSGNAFRIFLGGSVVDVVTVGVTDEGDRIITVTLDDPLTDSLIRFVTEDQVEVELNEVSVMEAPCAIRQLVPDPTFEESTSWDFSGNFIYNSDDGKVDRDSGMAEKTMGAVGEVSVTVDIQAGCYYKLEFEVIDHAITGTDEVRIKLGGNTVFTLDINTPIGVNDPVYIYLTDTTNTLLEFDADAGAEIQLDDILLWELSAMGFTVQDKNDITVFVGQSTYAATTAQGEIDWSTIAQGCYNICVYDLCKSRANRIINGEFDDSASWNVGAPWAISGGTANVNSVAGGTLDQDITLTAKTIYRLKYDVLSWSNIGTASIDVMVNDQTIQTISTAGNNVGKYTHSVIIDTVVNAKLEFVLNADGNNVNVDIDNVKFEQLTGCLSGELVTNGQFLFDGEWIKTGGWAISGGNANNTVPIGDVSQSIPLQPNTQYTLTFDVVIIQNKTITVTYNGVTILVINTGGSKTVEFTTSGTISDPFLKFSDVIDVPNGNNIEIDNVSIIQEDCGQEFCSECYSLRDNHPCSVLVEWTNPKNAMGYNYEDLTFTQALRLEALIRRGTYIDDYDTQNTESDGDLKQVAVRSRKQHQFAISQAPEYIHDALEQGRKHKVFTIDDIKYRKVGSDYIPNWRDFALVAPAIMDIQREDQPNREMTNC